MLGLVRPQVRSVHGVASGGREREKLEGLCLGRFSAILCKNQIKSQADSGDNEVLKTDTWFIEGLVSSDVTVTECEC